jgi:ADP-ribose pyrophosphatase YjhB (NUDIX family)
MDTRTVGNRPRRVCRFCGAVHFPDPKVGVGVLAVRDDELLLVRRAVAPEIGRWSGAGWLSGCRRGPAGGGCRETLAEANLVVDVGDLVDVYANPSAGDATVFLLYRADAVGGELRAGDDAADARFFGRTGLPGLAFASTVDAVRRWLATRPD